MRGAVSSFRHTVPLLALTRVQQSRLESLLGSVAHAHSFQSHFGRPGPLGPLRITGNYYVARGTPAHKKEAKGPPVTDPPVVRRSDAPGGGTKHGLLGPGPGMETGPSEEISSRRAIKISPVARHT